MNQKVRRRAGGLEEGRIVKMVGQSVRRRAGGLEESGNDIR